MRSGRPRSFRQGLLPDTIPAARGPVAGVHEPVGGTHDPVAGTHEPIGTNEEQR